MKNYSIFFFADLKIYVFKPIFKSLSKIILLGENFSYPIKRQFNFGLSILRVL